MYTSHAIQYFSQTINIMQMMIPKIIHYCWFGGKPLPKSALRCIKSWQKYLPDYEIKRWDESNYDVNKIPYIAEAYTAKKYAFVSDYARFDILYQYGGLYFDTDVEIINSLDDIIAKGPFMGCENDYTPIGPPEALGIAPGLGLGVNPGLGLYKEIINYYKNLNFILPNGQASPETVVTHISRLLCSHGLKNTPDIQCVEGVYIYPKDYFCPISTVDGKLRITKNTRSIHHYDQSWQSPMRKYGRKVILALGGSSLKNFLKSILYKK